MGEAMNHGVNVLTNSQTVIVDKAEDYIAEYNEGRITAEELYEKILNADVVYIDRSKTSEFKDSKDS